MSLNYRDTKVWNSKIIQNKNISVFIWVILLSKNIIYLSNN